jgi:DNA-binding NtrC family response regulator
MDRLELVVFAGDAMTRHPLPERGRVILGRAPECDVRINDASISRQHAALDIGPPITLHDLGSANGTHVRRPGAPDAETQEMRRRPGETFALGVGDRVVLGSVTALLRYAQAPVADGDPLAGTARDPAMTRLLDEAARVALGTINVLILGETGAGKEVLARAIHKLSPRASGPFIAVHCAALSESLLEGELFGYEKGAFTGASQARPGLLEAADGGTVLLDEIGELELAVQVKLLRVLEERAVLRIGARAPKAIGVRFLAATNRDLEAEVARGAFREDLFYRLSGVTLTVPPLRARHGEIAPLARHFLAEASRTMDRARVPDLSDAALAAIERYAWPGNVRELRNAMERAVMLASGDTVTLEHLPAKIVAPVSTRAAPADPAPSSGRDARPIASAPRSLEEIDAAKAAFERQQIVEALEKCGGNQTRAAELLGISRRTLVTRLGEYGLPRPRRRE